MKITKFVHSCLLIEDSKNILIDPGEYSEPAINVDKLPKIDYILITHEHPDHLSTSLIEKINRKFHDIKIITNSSAAKALPTAETKGDSNIVVKSVPHEKVFGSEPPVNVLFEVLSRVTHPGDSFHFSLDTKVLAMPLQAPWGSLVEAVAKIEELKPAIVLPIHDWHWNNEARKGLYERLVGYLETKNIKFVPLETGKPVDLSV